MKPSTWFVFQKVQLKKILPLSIALLLGFLFVFMARTISNQNRIINLYRLQLSHQEQAFNRATSQIANKAAYEKNIGEKTTVEIEKPNSNAGFSTSLIIFSSTIPLNENEKVELRNKVINPYFDYFLEQDNVKQPLALVVTKTNTEGYSYSISVYTLNSSNSIQMPGHAFLVQGTPLNLSGWQPRCLGPCEFSESFKSKYPWVD